MKGEQTNTGEEELFTSDQEFKVDVNNSLKDTLLDESFQEAEFKNNNGEKEKTHKQKKPFLKTGIAILIIAIICIGIINFVPWLYIKYDSTLVDSGEVEQSYYIDLWSDEDNYFDSEVENLFIQQNSTMYSGIVREDFKQIPNLSMYSFLILGVIGLILILLAIISRIRDVSPEIMISIHSIFSVIIIIICIYIVFLNMKFLSASLLMNYNYKFLNQIIPNFVMLFPAPLILIFMTSGLMKAAFSLLKIKFRESVKEFDEDTKDKSIYNLVHGGIK